MTAIKLTSDAETEETLNRADPFAGGDSSRRSNRSTSSERKSETVYTFDALRKRDTSTPVIGQVEESPRKLSVGKSEWLIGSLILMLIIQGVILASWTYVLVKLRTMKHTFAWITILSPFGSIYRYEECGSAPELCPVSNNIAVPYVPVVGILLGAIQILNTVTFLAWTACRKPFLLYLKESAFLNILFMIFQGITSGLAFYKGLAELEPRLNMEMTKSSAVGSGRWETTQVENHCCGIGGVADWAEHNRSIPKACYMTPTCQETASSICVYWPRGCLKVERAIVLCFARVCGGTLIAGGLISVATYLVAKRFLQTKKPVVGADQTPAHRMLIRQGSQCTAFGRKGKYHQVIRKDGILIEMTGALASATGINENVISMEILDCSPADKVTTANEMDRITIVVTKHGIVRGRAVITAQNDGDLRNVQVQPTQFGVMVVVKNE